MRDRLYAIGERRHERLEYKQTRLCMKDPTALKGQTILKGPMSFKEPEKWELQTKRIVSSGVLVYLHLRALKGERKIRDSNQSMTNGTA